jgi:hypothetical protein
VSGDAAEWDTNLNLNANAFVTEATYDTTSGGAITALTLASDPIQIYNYAATATYTLATTSVPVGYQCLIVNESAYVVTVNASGGATVLTLAPGTSGLFTAKTAAPTTAAGWDFQYGAVSVASGAALTVSASGYAVAPATPIAATSTGAQIPFGTAKTQIVQIAIPAASITLGQTYKVQSYGINGAGTNNITFAVSVGTNGTTADVTVAQTVTPSCPVTVGSFFHSLVNTRVVGSGGSFIGQAHSNCGTTATQISSSTTAVSVSTTSGTVYITLWGTTSTNTHNVQVAFAAIAGA